LSITSTAAYAKQRDKLARKIAGNTDDAISLECALQIAQAELELARVRRAKVALIERASAFGELDPPQLTRAGFIRLLNAALRGGDIESIDASATMPSQVPSDGCCQNCASWTDTSAALLRSGTERFSTSLIEQNILTIQSCDIRQNEPNFSQFIQ